MIRIDAAWLATTPLDMRAGTDTALARVIATFGAARPHHAYVFANQRANRLKVLVHDGVGLWLAARRLHQGKFVWAPAGSPDVALEHAQLNALGAGPALAACGLARCHHRGLNRRRKGVAVAIGRCVNGWTQGERAHCQPW